jgi:hypothetical protein
LTKTGSDPWRVALIAVLTVAMIVFWDSALLWPIKIVVVFFHELSHAIAAWATGGSVVRIGLGMDQSGVTETIGGWRFVILNAGYVGSLLWGVGLLMASRRGGWARPALALLAGLVAIVALAFVRPLISFGFVFALLVAAALGLGSRRMSESLASTALQALGTFSVLYAFLDVRDDVLSYSGADRSDATMLADLTGIPAFVWGLGWMVAGIVTLWLARRRL